MHDAGETNLLPIKSYVTIKYYSISMTSYRDFLTKNRKCSEVTAGTRPMTSCPTSSVGRAADPCIEGRGFEPYGAN